MSRYEWERGEFTIPSAQWAKFKNDIRDAANKESASAYELASKIHAELKVVKGKHPDGIRRAAWDVGQRLAAPPSHFYPARYTEGQIKTAVDSILKGDYSKERLVVPKKMNFPTFGNNTTAIDGADFRISFDNEHRKVVWNVDENNHACDHARESVVGVAFFKALDAVTWTRGSGGTIFGNDEYNRDAGRDYEGGGGSYAKGSWGPETKPKPRAASQPLAIGYRGRW